MNDAVHLRNFTDEDIDQFKQWLYQPHVAAWYHHPENWIHEIRKRQTEFQWIHHFIAEHHHKPIGFAQYYPYTESGETWNGTIPLAGTYSIDYLIGDPEYLKKGFGRQIVCSLINQISLHPDAKRIIVQPEPENLASCKTLLSSNFIFNPENKLYLYDSYFV